MEAFDASPDCDNTAIVFWGDHGWHLEEKLHWRKFSLWEEATRAPLIIAAPDVTTENTRSERTVSFLDLYPTIADLCGVPGRKEFEGHSLRPLLANPKADWNRPAVTTWGKDNHSIRSERWRYTRDRDGTEELYDHTSDPLE